MLLRSSIRERRTCRPWYNRPEATIRDVAEDYRATVGCLQDHARCSCSCSGGSRRGFGLWAASTRGGRGRRAFCFLVQNCSRAVPRRLTPICVPHTLLCAGPPPHSISLPSPLLPPKPIFPLCPRPPLPIPALPLRAPANPSHQENDLGERALARLAGSARWSARRPRSSAAQCGFRTQECRFPK